MMADYLGEFSADAAVWYHEFETVASGILTDLVGATIAVRKNNDITEYSGTGATLTVGFDGRTGVHLLTIDFSQDATFFSAGSHCRVFFTAGTLEGAPLNGHTILYFSIERQGGALALLKDATIGLAALETLVDDLEARLPEILSLVGLIGPQVTVVDHISNSTTSFQVDSTVTDADHWKDAWLSFDATTTTVALRHQVKRVTAFNPTTDFITVQDGFTVIPQAGDTARMVTR
jgi:hypothetical protein